MKLSITTSESLSALADDQLDDEEVAALLSACKKDESALDCWNTYHLIGEVLRSPPQALAPVVIHADRGFVSRLGRRLAQEAPLERLAVDVDDSVAMRLQSGVEPVQQRDQASNDGNFRWKLVAGLASLAALSTIAWHASGLLAPTAGPLLAQSSSVSILVSSPQGPVVRDSSLDELFAAHRRFGTTSALQEPSGFLRNATFEMPQEPVVGR